MGSRSDSPCRKYTSQTCYDPYIATSGDVIKYQIRCDNSDDDVDDDDDDVDDDDDHDDDPFDAEIFN